MNKLTFGALALVVITTFVGCSSTPIAQPSTSAPIGTSNPQAASSKSGSGSTQPVEPSTVSSTMLPAYLDPKNPISTQRSVYFDFDDFSVKGEYRGLVERHARYLMTAPEVPVKIEGSADERGSSEYNLALGQKRAEAVVKALEIYGVRHSQLEATSWGAERPKALGHDEDAWAQNRRADLTYPKQ